MILKKDQILLVLTENWNDWEASYAIAVANSFTDYKVQTVAIDKMDKVSMGGIRARVDLTMNTFNNFTDLAMVILPGGLSWMEKDYHEIAYFLKKASKQEVPIAAICGATEFLCKQGFLNNINHTGDSLEQFQTIKGYTGEEHYVQAQVVVDQGFITANETAAVAFAYEIFKILAVDSEEEMAEWFDNFIHGAIR
ncbi:MULTISPECIES: DJ-1/PfpI family protein [Enterococcus]|uniref:DJ-1/PfpI family protein n=1 Tax=Enterococcus TaxID=1350 RepID=UPI00166B654B|nr:DJ-1/PfpI family protein [Enterococcus alcedinis]